LFFVEGYFGRRQMTIYIELIPTEETAIKRRNERGALWIERTKACPQCPKTLGAIALSNLIRAVESIEQGEKLVEELNALTLKARKREIGYRKYIRARKKLNEQWELGYGPSLSYTSEGMGEDCKVCDGSRRIKIEVWSDKANFIPSPESFVDYFIEPKLLPIEEPYRKRKVLQKCPKCGMFGSAWIDKRGYQYFQHVVEGKKMVCYIGKVPLLATE